MANSLLFPEVNQSTELRSGINSELNNHRSWKQCPKQSEFEVVNHVHVQSIIHSLIIHSIFTAYS